VRITPGGFVGMGPEPNADICLSSAHARLHA
jgi:hypothetical protein